jgi:hypothetical protein
VQKAAGRLKNGDLIPVRKGTVDEKKIKKILE